MLCRMPQHVLGKLITKQDTRSSVLHVTLFGLTEEVVRHCVADHSSSHPYVHAGGLAQVLERYAAVLGHVVSDFEGVDVLQTGEVVSVP